MLDPGDFLKSDRKDVEEELSVQKEIIQYESTYLPLPTGEEENGDECPPQDEISEFLYLVKLRER